ncbi:MAG: 4-hydroxy-tetrahydrodipicolinate synthase [Vampirovibrionales bacterium]|nr:4-hydroxy-tetrahydrodipicolinate synthase [Vampirovibrionales bacterium]
MPHFTAELVPAMVTPFHRDGSVDFEKLELMALYLIENGCDGLLVNGTTGEAPTLGFDEKTEILRAVKKAISGQKMSDGRQIPIMSGVGSNDTKKSVEEAKKIAAIGVDALLVVVPYYNKPSQRGMIAHFSQIAQAVPDTEIVIYNIPGRCGVLMSADTMLELHRTCPNIIGVKQSLNDMDALSEITAKLSANTWLTWCGDDSLTVPMIACGAHGTISVSAHLVGSMMREMIQAAKAGDRQKALGLHVKLLHINREIFFLPNPTVLKTCLARLGLLELSFRAPMIEPDDEEMRRIEKLLADYKSLLPQRV